MKGGGASEAERRAEEEARAAAEARRRAEEEARRQQEQNTQIQPLMPQPAPAPAPAPAPVPPVSGPFPNCAAARAAGAAPVYIGQPGYGPHLDRDRDGIGCE